MALNGQLFIALMLIVPATLQQVARDSISLYPRPTETRQIQSLDGVWNFRLSNSSNDGFKSEWFRQSLVLLDNHYERMPVPSSFNDITEKREIRDFSGWVWYDREFFVPNNWMDRQILLRFGSVNYIAVVYVNGQWAVNHTGGHLPFQADVTKLLKIGMANHISVAVNNELSMSTLPQGEVQHAKDSHTNRNFSEVIPRFDFFPYAGIHRSVLLWFVPPVRIVDVTVQTSTLSDLTTGLVKYEIVTNAASTKKYVFKVELFDRNDSVVVKANSANGQLTVPKANLWWPFTMSDQSKAGYLYKLAIKLTLNGQLVDSIYQQVGIRNVTLTKSALLVNGKSVYLRGFGKHEEQNVRGRSMDQSMIMKDFNLMKWIGANSFRTSHYPYSEAIMDEADEQGFIVIDEVPAVSLDIASDNGILLQQHLVALAELIERDKNRPSVFMWSIANEPVLNRFGIKEYFEKVANQARQLDPSTRPITAAIAGSIEDDYVSFSVDVIMLNRYEAWYSDTGYPQVIQDQLVSSFVDYFAKFQKPIMISEYGADTIAGMHSEPTFVFSEDYQVELMLETHKAFDILRSKGFFIGEHIWNFADFMTHQDITRVGGNKKGIFTRERQPKTSARLLRCRYWLLSGDTSDSNREGFSLCPKVVY